MAEMLMRQEQHHQPLNEISELSCEQRVPTEESSSNVLQADHSLTNLHFNLSETDLIRKKRPSAAGRVTHESRLQNLVQTI
jgi:hypothetical protein